MEPGLSICLLLVLVILAALTALALQGRVVFRLAVRNFSRRKAQSALVVAGLMVGTAIISSSLVVGDTMRYLFEVETYRSLGEVDHVVSGTDPAGGLRNFDGGVYSSLSDGLSSVEGIEAVAPALFVTVSVLNPRTQLAEPSVVLRAFNSSVMRTSAFGSLDGAGFYTDALARGEVALNSRLGEALEARPGDVLTVAYGSYMAGGGSGPVQIRLNLTIARLIQEKQLFGRANYEQVKALFMELSTAQELFNLSGKINTILISDKGDMREGESWSPKVNRSILRALDGAVGMRELGLRLAITGDGLELTSTLGHFPASHASLLLEKGAAVGAKALTATVAPLLSVNGAPPPTPLALGFNTTDPSIPVVESGELAVLSGPASSLNLSNGTSISLASRGLDGVVRSINLKALVLPPGPELLLSPEIRNVTFGFLSPGDAQHLVTGGVYPVEILSFARIWGPDPRLLEAIASSVRAELDDRITAGDAGLEVHDVKYDGLKRARAGGEAIGQIFMIFSVFAIIAGIVLIVNIFVMLAEERKGEMGIVRAIGMMRRQLVRMFLFEGAIYVLLASAVGGLAGLGLGYLLIQAFGVIFTGVAQFPFFFRWESVLTAFCGGVLLTLITIYITTRRGARLNIIRAIRRIPEPRGSRAMKSDIQYGALMLVSGLLITLFAASAKIAWAWLAGPCLLFLGLGLLLHKWVSLRAAMSFSSTAILVWVFNPFPLPIVSEAVSEGAGLDMFVVSGVFLVIAGVLLMMFNSDALLSLLQRIMGRSGSLRAALKLAVAYPMDRKGRTGMTLAMFSLVIFTVTVIAMIAAMQASMMENIKGQQSGGYDIIGFTGPGTPFQNLSLENLPSQLRERDIRQLHTLSTSMVALVGYDEMGGGGGSGIEMGQPIASGSRITQLYGAGEDFLERNGFPLQERDSNYTSDRECWLALKNNRSLCIIDGSRFQTAYIQGGPSFGGQRGAYAGGTVTVTDLQGQNRTRTLRVIGVMHQMYFFQGIVVNRELVSQEYSGADRLLLVDLGPHEDSGGAMKDFKRAYLENGLVVIDINAIISIVTTSISNVMYLMEAFLAVGLFIGIAGIGIVSYRNVIERRQQIGMMRAVGFTRRMVASSFLIETSFVTILAIFIGILLGVGIGWQIFDGGGYRELGASFVIPVENILIIALGAYLATILFTFYPSLMAAKVPPAEALRYVE